MLPKCHHLVDDEHHGDPAKLCPLSVCLSCIPAVFHGSSCLSLATVPTSHTGLPFSPVCSLLCPSQVGPL